MSLPRLHNRQRRVILVDDHPVVRAGLAAVIAQDPHYAISAECSTAEQAVDAVKRHEIDLALVDLTLGTGSAIALIPRLIQHRPNLRILVVSIHDESVFASAALRAGAHGYLMKDAPLDVIRTAVRTVSEGRIYLSDPMREQMLQAMSGRRQQTPEGIKQLSPAELAVLQMIGTGASPREIAAQLGRSIKTIETHRFNIQRKLELRGSAALVHFATKTMFQDGMS